MNFNKINESLGFELHEWQKKYIEDKHPLWDIPPKSGKTTAYMIKLLTNETTDIPFGDLKFLTDGDFRDEEYYKWFVKNLIKLKTKLDNSGIETRRIVK